MNIKCSNRYAKPVRFGSSNREPTRYAMLTATIGRVWSSWRMIVIPFESFEVVLGIETSSAPAGKEARDTATKSAAEMEWRRVASAVMGALRYGTVSGSQGVRGRTPWRSSSVISFALVQLGSTMLAPVGEAYLARTRERELVDLAQAGDKNALGELLTQFGPTLYRSVLLPRLGSEAAAKDALSETYTKVIERIGQFRWQGVGFYPWLRVVALRVAIDALRARRRLVLWKAED